MTKNANFFFYDVDIQLILELKKTFFENIIQSFLKILILGHHVNFTLWIQINVDIKYKSKDIKLSIIN